MWTKSELQKMGIEDAQAVQHGEYTIQQALECVMAGKPLPSGAVRNAQPVYNRNYVNDNRISDELIHVENMRRNLENLVKDYQDEQIIKRAYNNSKKAAQNQNAKQSSDSVQSSEPDYKAAPKAE